MIRQVRKYLTFSTFIRVSLIILLAQLLVFLYRYSEINKKNTAEYLTYLEQTGGLSGNLAGLQYLNFLNTSEGSWQKVESFKGFKFLVFSAFLDVRTSRFVRVIAVTRTVKAKPVWCKLWNQIGLLDFQAKTVEGKLQIIKEHWGLAYSAYYIICPLNLNDQVPEAVSILSQPKEMPKNILKIIINYDDKRKWNPLDISPVVNKMAVCVKPLHYDYNEVMELLEFIELHQIMGVSHFFLYQHSVGPQVNCILKKYQENETVTVLPWQLPIESQKEIRTEGIFASLNDCLYRTMHKYSHTIFVDFDEYIIPTNNYTYMNMFEYFDKLLQIQHKSVFSFRNAFFYRQWPDDPDLKMLSDPIAQNLIVLKKTIRKTALHRHNIRSKYIVRPELVNMVGNHFIWEYYNKDMFGSMQVDPSDGFMHHYRVCEFGGDDCVTQSSTVDKTAYRYKDALITAVKNRYIEYLADCQLENIDGQS